MFPEEQESQLQTSTTSIVKLCPQFCKIGIKVILYMHSHKLSVRKSKYHVKSIYNTKRKITSIKSQFSFIQLNKDTPSTATGLANLILKEIFYIKKMLRSLKFNLYTYLINFSAARRGNKNHSLTSHLAVFSAI